MRKDCENCDIRKVGCENHCPIEKSRRDKHRSDINRKKNRKDARDKKTHGYFYGDDSEE